MLILTRKEGESICIGENITVTLLGINGNQTKIGIAADKSVPIYREELLLKPKESATSIPKTKTNSNIASK